jgi:hypothetical protein
MKPQLFWAVVNKRGKIYCSGFGSPLMRKKKNQINRVNLEHFGLLAQVEVRVKKIIKRK